MPKPPSGLFIGTKGEIAFHGDAENIIASRTVGLDLQEHPTNQKQLSAKVKRSITQKIRNRTATREEYELYMWDKRFGKRRRNGIKNYWKQERNRLERGERGTRNWSSAQRADILAGKIPKFNGRVIQAHHTYSARKYPHLANLGAVIYPATHYEHHMGWHGGNYRNSLPGRRIRPIHEF